MSYFGYATKLNKMNKKINEKNKEKNRKKYKQKEIKWGFVIPYEHKKIML